MKKVVTKSLEKEYSENFPLNEISNNSFDWLNFYQEKFGKNDINGLLFLYRYRDDVPIGSSNLKEMIISSLSPWSLTPRTKFYSITCSLQLLNVSINSYLIYVYIFYVYAYMHAHMLIKDTLL